MIQAALAFAAASIIIATPASKEPGDELYTQKDGVNVRTGPSGSASRRPAVGAGSSSVSSMSAERGRHGVRITAVLEASVTLRSRLSEGRNQAKRGRGSGHCAK